MRQADTTTGRVQDPTGRSFDLALITNAPDGLLSRDYAGGTFTGTYRFGRCSTSAATTRCREPGATSTPRTWPAARCRSTIATGIQAGLVELP